MNILIKLFVFCAFMASNLSSVASVESANSLGDFADSSRFLSNKDIKKMSKFDQGASKRFSKSDKGKEKVDTQKSSRKIVKGIKKAEEEWAKGDLKQLGAKEVLFDALSRRDVAFLTEKKKHRKLAKEIAAKVKKKWKSLSALRNEIVQEEFQLLGSLHTEEVKNARLRIRKILKAKDSGFINGSETRKSLEQQTTDRMSEEGIFGSQKREMDFIKSRYKRDLEKINNTFRGFIASLKAYQNDLPRAETLSGQVDTISRSLEVQLKQTLGMFKQKGLDKKSIGVELSTKSKDDEYVREGDISGREEKEISIGF
ncbi:hypothetical protein HOD08_02685 [bacterium]|nr:hypothetical protein [bacterium]